MGKLAKKLGENAEKSVNFLKNSGKNAVLKGDKSPKNSRKISKKSQIKKVKKSVNFLKNSDKISNPNAKNLQINARLERLIKNTQKGFIFLISGPSGAGKSTLLAKLTSEFKDELYFSVSCTTRSPRDGEVEGVDYHFISEESFKKGIAKGEFLEYAFVHSNFYGTRLKETEQALSAGKIVVFDIDVQGFHQISDRLKGLLTSVFITTKSAKELEKRLLNRASNDDIKKRLKNAKEEMKTIMEYDFCIINEDLQLAYEQLKSIFVAQKLRISRYNAKEILQLWTKGE